MRIVTKVDAHGVVDYKTWFHVSMLIASVLIVMIVGGYSLMTFESGSEGANMKTLGDSIWTVFMIMSTIGFGDFFPVTLPGRLIAVTCFILGAIHFGKILNLLSGDSAIQNRELRTMLAELMRKGEEAESHFNIDTDINVDSHNIDTVVLQSKYSSRMLKEGFITGGIDSSGCRMLSIEAYNRSDGSKYRRWIPCADDAELDKLFHRYLRNENEL